MLKIFTATLLSLTMLWGQAPTVFPRSGESSLKNPETNQFQWHTSYSLQMLAIQGRVLSLGLLTGNWSYRYSRNLLIQGQIGLLQSGFANGRLPFAPAAGPRLLWRGKITYSPRPGLSLQLELGQYPYFPYNQSYLPGGLPAYTFPGVR